VQQRYPLVIERREVEVVPLLSKLTAIRRAEARFSGRNWTGWGHFADQVSVVLSELHEGKRGLQRLGGLWRRFERLVEPAPEIAMYEQIHAQERTRFDSDQRKRARSCR